MVTGELPGDAAPHLPIRWCRARVPPHDIGGHDLRLHTSYRQNGTARRYWHTESPGPGLPATPKSSWRCCAGKLRTETPGRDPGETRGGKTSKDGRGARPIHTSVLGEPKPEPSYHSQSQKARLLAETPKTGASTILEALQPPAPFVISAGPTLRIRRMETQPRRV